MGSILLTFFSSLDQGIERDENNLSSVAMKAFEEVRAKLRAAGSLRGPSMPVL